MNLGRAKFLGVLGAVVAAACGSGSSGGASGGGGSGGGGTGPGPDAGGTTDAGGATPDAGATGAASGEIRFMQGTQSGTTTYDSSAGFAKAPPGSTGGTLPSVTTAGDCNVAVIPYAGAGNDDGGVSKPISGLNAGTIVVSGGGGGKGNATLVYGPSPQIPGYSNYARVDGTGAFFVPGDTLVATGAGGPDLPAFTARVAVPSDVTITNPACSVAGCDSLDRSTDLHVTWTGGGVGKVKAFFETLSNTAVAILSCTFDSAAGQGTIAASVLAKLEKAGDPGISGIEGFLSTNETKLNVGGAATIFVVDGQGSTQGLTVAK